MPEDTQDEQLQKWQARVEVARRYQQQFGNTEGRWDTNIKALAGDFNSVSELGEEAIDVNMVRSGTKVTLPPLWITDPHITVRPTTKKFKGADNVMRAEKTDIEINYWLRELQVRKQVRKVLLDGEATNLGYLYLGYTKTKQEIEGEPDPLVRVGQPFVKRMSPKRVLVPPGKDDLEECPWVDLVFLLPLERVKEKWPGTTKDLEATVSMDAIDEGTESAAMTEYKNSDDAKFVEVHNCWCKDTEKVYIFAKDHDRYLEEPKDWPYEMEGFPLALYRPEEIPDEYHGTPPLSYAMPQQKERNATRTSMRKVRNRTKSIIWIDAEIAKEAKEAYAKAHDGEMVPLDLNGEDIRSKMMKDDGLPISNSDLAYDALTAKDYQEVTGQSAEQRGGGDPNVDSATASANIEKNVQIRNSDRGDRVRDLYLTVARKLWMILKQFPNQKRSRLIAGPLAGQFTEIEYTLAELRGEFDFEMDFSAMLADNPQTRQTQAILNYNLLRADPKIDPDQLILDIFRSQNKVEPEAYMLTLREPTEELQLMLAALPVEAHDRDDHEQHLQIHDGQSAQLEQVLDQEPDNGKAQTAQILLISHIQDHVRRLTQITGQQAGKPVAENLLRNQVKAARGTETQAELSGQPLNPEQLVS